MKGLSGTPVGEMTGVSTGMGVATGIGVATRGDGVVSIVSRGGVARGVAAAISFGVGFPRIGMGVATGTAATAPVSGTGVPGSTVSMRTSSGPCVGGTAVPGSTLATGCLRRYSA